MPGPHAGNRNRPAYSGQPRFRFPKQIIQLFAARKPLAFKPPPRKRRLRPMTGLAAFLSHFEDPNQDEGGITGTEKTTGDGVSPMPTVILTQQQGGTNDDAMRDAALDEAHGQLTNASLSQEKRQQSANNAVETTAPDIVESPFETPAQRRRRLATERRQRVQTIVAEARKQWDPFGTETSPTPTPIPENKDNDDKHENNDITTISKTRDPYNTLFVYNIPRTALTLTLRHHFEQYGPVQHVALPTDHDGIPRGYAFVEFVSERDVEIAIKRAHESRFGERRLRVDVERGRTVKGWFPNRLDGPNNSAARVHHRRRVLPGRSVALP